MNLKEYYKEILNEELLSEGGIQALAGSLLGTGSIGSAARAAVKHMSPASSTSASSAPYQSDDMESRRTQPGYGTNPSTGSQGSIRVPRSMKSRIMGGLSGLVRPSILSGLVRSAVRHASSSLVSEEALGEAYAAKTKRRRTAADRAQDAAKGQSYRGVANSSAAYTAARKDYFSADEGRMRSVRRRAATPDTVRDAAVALASTPSGRAAAENEAVERLRSRGLAGGSPVLRAAALAGKRPSGPNLRALIAKARQIYDGVEPI